MFSFVLEDVYASLWQDQVPADEDKQQILSSNQLFSGLAF